MSKTSVETLTKITSLAQEGKSSKEIGQIVEKSAKAIQKLFVRYNLPHLPQGGQFGSKNHFYKNGRTIDKDGYILILSPAHPFANSSGYVREHRLVMEQQLGRWLTPLEVVDHIDGNKQHNDPSNLRLFAKNADHIRVTLKGKIPKWSSDGIQKIQEAAKKSLKNRKRNATGHLLPKNDVV